MWSTSATMPFTFVYRTDYISTLSRSSLDSTEKPAVRYTNVNSLVCRYKLKINHGGPWVMHNYNVRSTKYLMLTLKPDAKRKFA